MNYEFVGLDYEKIFNENPDTKFFYTDYHGNKMVVGTISLKNAIARLTKNEYYVLVTYHEGETLPEGYVPLSELKSDDGTLFATLNKAIDFYAICKGDGGIQLISRLPDSNGSPNYLLGRGPEQVSLDDLIMAQYNKHYGNKTTGSK